MDENKSRLRKNDRHLTAVVTPPRADKGEPPKSGDKPSAGSDGSKARKPPVVRLVKPAGKGPPPEVAAHVTRRLKAVYDDVLNQPIPDRFLDLLSKLDSEESK